MKEEIKKPKARFIDLFAGIGGFHIGLHNLGCQCVFACEIDAKARITYTENFKEISPSLFNDYNFAEDIQKVDPKAIPDFEILTAGFPCQTFSQAGRRRGFEEARGTLFFDIAKILDIKRPKAYFLENVQHLQTHDKGKTFEKIKKILTQDLGYSLFYKIVKASDFGLPQRRPRIFMVGFKNTKIKFEFPKKRKKLLYTMSNILGGSCNRDIGYTLRVGGRGSPIDDRRNWDSYCVDGKVVQIGPKEALKMQGFPDWFSFPTKVKTTQAMKQLGNSVAIPAIQATAKEILKKIND
jgi:DNA (cytosine-5)-methyltransferase 1